VFDQIKRLAWQLLSSSVTCRVSSVLWIHIESVFIIGME
jgi:hypothetical protein